MRRHALVSPLEVFGLASQNLGAAEAAAGTGLPIIDAAPIVYSSLLQAGLDQLLLFETNRNVERYVLHHSRRLRFIKGKGYGEALALASEYTHHAETQNLPLQAQHALALLWGFLAGLLYSLRTRYPMITFTPPPRSQYLAGCLPPDVGLPVANLLDRLSPVVLNVAAPALTIDVRDIALFEEALADRTYRKYVTTHADLQDADTPSSKVREAIQQRARQLARRHSLLQIERLTVSTLMFSGRFIDKVLSKVEGQLGKELAELGAQLLAERQRIVIYYCGDIFARISALRFRHALATGAIDLSTLRSRLASRP